MLVYTVVTGIPHVLIRVYSYSEHFLPSMQLRYLTEAVRCGILWGPTFWQLCATTLAAEVWCPTAQSAVGGAPISTPGADSAHCTGITSELKD